MPPRKRKSASSSKKKLSSSKKRGRSSGGGDVAAAASASTSGPLLPATFKVTLAQNMTDNKTGKQVLKDVRGWMASEKLDGERAVWDGVTLRTRNNKTISAPEWFTRVLPRDVALDGELHCGRENFQETMSAVRKNTPVEKEWRRVTYSVFDSPTLPGPFSERLEALLDLFKEKKYGTGASDGALSHVKLVSHVGLRNQEHLDGLAKRLVEDGAEGVMVRNPDSLYENKRTKNLLKVKPLYDAEARVVGHEPGKGKYAGMLGALSVKDVKSGAEFSVGSGLTDEDRKGGKRLFPAGAIITYRYLGLTDAGIPRHPTFWRVRPQ